MRVFQKLFPIQVEARIVRYIPFLLFIHNGPAVIFIGHLLDIPLQDDAHIHSESICKESGKITLHVDLLVPVIIFLIEKETIYRDCFIGEGTNIGGKIFESHDTGNEVIPQLPLVATTHHLTGIGSQPLQQLKAVFRYF